MQEKQPDINPHDRDSWTRVLSYFGILKGANGLLRLHLLRLHQNTSMHRAFSCIMGTEDLIVNHDRWLLHRPQAVGSRKPLQNKRNVHLDMNPWEYQDNAAKDQIWERLSSLQYTSINTPRKTMYTSPWEPVVDITTRENGGTVLIPGFFHTFDSWVEHCADPAFRKEGPMQYFLPDKDALQSLVQHPTLRAGSLLIWDQWVMHGSTPITSQCTVLLHQRKHSLLLY